jgi:hypothetical protein
LLQVLVGTKCGQTTEEDNSIQTDTEPGGVGGVGWRSDRAGNGGLGLGIAGLKTERKVSMQKFCHQVHLVQGAAEETYVALQVPDQELLERLTGLIAVADILEGLSGILAGNVEQNLLTTAV